MEYESYVNVNIKNLKENLKYIKNNYAYDYYILNVSNEAFYHGMYIINYLTGIDYLYVNSLNDLRLVRKYNKNIAVIYDGIINEDIIYEGIINNAILVIKDKSVLSMGDIKDDLEFIVKVDPLGYEGLSKKVDMQDIFDLANSNSHLKFKGIMAKLEEQNYDDFKYITSVVKNWDLLILNFEDDKKKIRNSNAILVDYSIYGYNNIKKSLFKKEEGNLKQVFSLNSKIVNIVKETKKKKTIYLGIVPLGYYRGIGDKLTKVRINNKFYLIQKITSQYMIVVVDEDIKINDKVIITDESLPLENYYDGNILGYLATWGKNLPVIYDGEVNLVG